MVNVDPIIDNVGFLDSIEISGYIIRKQNLNDIFQSTQSPRRSDTPTVIHFSGRMVIVLPPSVVYA